MTTRAFAKACAFSLEAGGYEVVGEVEDGRSGLSEAERLEPEVLLLDVFFLI